MVQSALLLLPMIGFEAGELLILTPSAITNVAPRAQRKIGRPRIITVGWTVARLIRA
jgi:hypothetical protein